MLLLISVMQQVITRTAETHDEKIEGFHKYPLPVKALALGFLIALQLRLCEREYYSVCQSWLILLSVSRVHGTGLQTEPANLLIARSMSQQLQRHLAAMASLQVLLLSADES
jgi:hypothetical protein